MFHSKGFCFKTNMMWVANSCADGFEYVAVFQQIPEKEDQGFILVSNEGNLESISFGVAKLCTISSENVTNSKGKIPLNELIPDYSDLHEQGEVTVMRVPKVLIKSKKEVRKFEKFQQKKGGKYMKSDKNENSNSTTETSESGDSIFGYDSAADIPIIAKKKVVKLGDLLGSWTVIKIRRARP